METRQKTEYKIYFLYLADVRGGIDRAEAVVAFDDLQKLINWEISQRETWTDDSKSEDFYGHTHNYQKAYKKGSILEWYNPISDPEPRESPDNTGGIGFVWVEDIDSIRLPFNPE